mgnify:CR=1 FL=1
MGVVNNIYQSKKHYLLILLPVFTLALIQVLAFHLYDGFIYESSFKTKLSITITYLVFILSLPFFVFLGSNIDTAHYSKINNLGATLVVLAIIFAMYFLLKPAISLILMIFGGVDVAVLRENFFHDQGLRSNLFGSGFMAAFVGAFVVPFIWVVVFFLVNERSKWFSAAFYILCAILIIYGVSAGGRFAIYFSMLAIYVRYLVIYGRITPRLVFSILVMFALGVLIGLGRGIEGLLYSLFEYHIIQPFLLDQRLNHDFMQVYSVDIPFYAFLTNLFFPFYYVVNGSENMPVFQVGMYFSDFTLYSHLIGKNYNAYHTMFVFFYYDVGLYAPLLVIVFMFLLFFFMKMIRSGYLRIKYLSFLVFVLFHGLFQGGPFNPVYMAVIVGFPLFSILVLDSKYGKGKRNYSHL